MLQPGEFRLPREAPVGRVNHTVVLDLPNSGSAPTVKDFASLRGVWRAHCPDGNPQYVVTVKAYRSADTTVPVAADLNLPAAGSDSPITAVRSDEDFFLDATQGDEFVRFAFQWNGAGASTLILTRVFSQSSGR